MKRLLITRLGLLEKDLGENDKFKIALKNNFIIDILKSI